MNIADALKNAIEHDELYVVYQPIYHLTTLRIVGMEALARWKHSELGHISADTFIPIAEQDELINQLGHWILETVCKQERAWRRAGFNNFTISINVSPQQLLEKNFPHHITKILHENQTSPNTLIFEITETSVMPHFTISESGNTLINTPSLNGAEQVLRDIHELGIRIALDDFGTGYSSLIYLSRLPIQSFKIDKSFIQGIYTNTCDAVIVNTLITLGRELGYSVTAEGIENEHQLTHLNTNNCPLGQGYFLGNPLTAKEMTDLLKKSVSKVP